MKTNAWMKWLLVCTALMVAGAGNAWADGHRHSRVHVGIGFGHVVGPGYWAPGYSGAGYFPHFPPFPHPPIYYHPAYDYPVYAPVVIHQAPPVYIEQSAPPAAQQYWYYCAAARGYYPQVKSCAGGWMKVLPQDEE